MKRKSPQAKTKKRTFSPPELVLRFREIVWRKLWALEEATDTEYAAFGLVKDGVVEDLFIPNQVADGAATESDGEALLEAAVEINRMHAEEGYPYCSKDIKVQIHSHAGSGVFWSSDDHENMEAWTEQGHMWFLVLSRTAQGDKHKAAYRQTPPVPLFVDDIKVEVVRDGADIADWLKEAKSRVEKPKYTGRSGGTTVGFRQWGSSEYPLTTGASFEGPWDGWEWDDIEACDNCNIVDDRGLTRTHVDNEWWYLCPKCHDAFTEDHEPCEGCSERLDRSELLVSIFGEHILELCPSCVQDMFNDPARCCECDRVFEREEVTALGPELKYFCGGCVEAAVEEERAKAKKPTKGNGQKPVAKKVTPEQIRAAKTQRRQ